MNRKVFQHRHSWFFFFRRPAVSLFCLAFGIFGIAFGVIVVFRPISGYRCREFDVRTVSVSLTTSGNVVADRDSGGQVVEGTERRKVMGFVGIQTGFASAGRRRSLRKTWMPADREGLKRLEEATGLTFRFVIGKTTDPRKMSDLRKEIEEYDDFMLLDIEEGYSNLPHKTLAFFTSAYGLYDADFYVKADDDIYLRPDRLSALLAKERSHPLTYLGCMKREYFLHAYGPIYALSAKVVGNLVALPNNSLRMFSNEDVTVGAWMLAMNVNHEHNMALCQTTCSSSSIAVWDLPKCSGLCSPEEQLLALHQMDICSGAQTAR
ncbi:putative beta-1-3-galactosyltransferase 14 [Nymphaea thermarum]|nr:putative beta-1-3-galactosyltransferase 14 [Nymphaea thermarum]